MTACQIAPSDGTIFAKPSSGSCSAGETFARYRRYGRMTKPDIWYVAFSPDRNSDLSGDMARSTRTFKSEIDAKLFAMQILAKGWAASAGTLNPHQPKQVIASSQIERWADPGSGGQPVKEDSAPLRDSRSPAGMRRRS